MKKLKIEPYIYVAPAVIITAAVLLFPLLYTFYMSFAEKILGKEVESLGFQNYVAILSEKRFFSSFVKSIVFTIVAVFIKLVVGLALALMLNRSFRGRNFLRAYFFLPWAIPWFTVAILFLWLFRLTGGVNTMIGIFGFAPIFWLGPDLALASAVIANVWKGFPFFMVSLLAGLQTIPKELYEAAQVDGASSFQQFLYITLPGLRNVILIVCTLSTIWTFGLFELIYIMTGGGPGDASKVLPILVYETGISMYLFGKGSAMAVLTVPFILVWVFVLVRLIRRAV
ncbi:MAG: sugar ABC transporter permease [Candidatus Bipolaricaulaceae bacterium]